MTTEKFKLICDDALQKLTEVQRRMLEQEQRLDKAFERYDAEMQKLIKQTSVRSVSKNENF